jgi:hypothetical protein
MSVNRVSQLTAAGKLTDLRSPHARGVAKIAIPLIALLVVFAFSASSALAASPWWHLSSTARPSYLKAGVGANEVQEIKVGATGGNVFVVEPISLQEALSGTGELKDTEFAYNATHEVVQSALEGPYGKGNVEVTGGPGDEKGTKPYVVTFKGALAGKHLELMNTEFSSFFGKLKGEAKVAEVTGGRTDGQLVVNALNLGDASTNGEVTITDTLPAGLQAVGVEAKVYEGVGNFSAAPVDCTLGSVVICHLAASLVPYTEVEARIGVLVQPGAKVCEPGSAGCEKNVVSVSGGGAPPAALSRPVTVNDQPVPFGLQEYQVTPEEEGGAPTTQAGRHPFQVTGTLVMNQTAASFNGSTAYEVRPVALPKDLAGLLPPGLIGNPSPFAKCTLAQFDASVCPAQSVIGMAMVGYDLPGLGGIEAATVPIVNLEPAHGEPARFGFAPIPQTPIFLDAHVRSGGDYGVTLSTSNLPQVDAFLSYSLTFWGVPGSSSHDAVRGPGCIEEARGVSSKEVSVRGLLPCVPLGESSPPPLLAMPTSCTGPLHTSTEADSWADPMPEGKRSIFGETAPMPAMLGCNRLPFEPQIGVTPDSGEASTPTGLNVDVHVPQDSILNGTSLAESNVKDVTVALPQDVAVNPAGGGGLEACSEQLAGYQGFKEFETSPGLSTPAFTSKLPGSFGSEESLQPGVNFCANASKIGTAKIKTPLLPNALEGSVYLATQESNPFGSLIAMYVVVEDPISGVLIKLAGQVHLTEAGQLVTTFEDTPQAAFEDAELHFFGGERAPLAAPAHCGPNTTTASFVPWAAEPSDVAAVTVGASSTFPITSGRGGSACPGQSLPFHPTVTGGATNIQAGAFSPFTATFSRADGEQNMQSVQAKLPPGLLGVLDGVELCPEPQANQGTCGPNSLIGETTVSVGVGGDPFSVRGGKFYLTGPYNGTGSCKVTEAGCAPFGITFVVPAKAGPFDLAKTQNNHPACDCVLVRGKIEIDPITAALTITSNPAGTPDSIPTILEGIPLQIQHINATTTRSAFQFNPTNCNKLEVTGTIQTSEGATDTLGVPFQVTNCAALKFEPKFAVTTSGKTSRAKGASLSVKLTYPKAPFGSQANIARVKVDLPKQLPSRLTTLQKACTAAQFNTNPAGCPAASLIGHARAITPLIPVPLEGPAIFVSHGGEAFPSLIIVLQGYGVTLDLVGTTFISKAGITSSTFKTVPDAPVGSFELTLPEGKFSALGTNKNLCTQKLTMPTEFVAQNGAKINESTKITVTGCHKAKRAAKHHKKGKGKGKKGKK